MKSLLDIQQDVRSLEKKITEITENLKSLNSDLEALRNVDRKVGGIDFTKIELLAKQLPFKNHPIRKLKDKSLCRLYLEMLLNLVRLDGDEKAKIERLIFVQWLKTEAEVREGLEELMMSSFQLDSGIYQTFVTSLFDENRKFYMVDALILANMGGELHKEMYAYIANLFEVLGIEREDIKIILLIAKATLTKEVKSDKSIDFRRALSLARLFPHYIERDILRKMIVLSRKVIIKCDESDYFEFAFCVRDGDRVKKGDVIADCGVFTRNKDLYQHITDRELTAEELMDTVKIVPEKLKTPEDGIVYTFEDDWDHVAVLADEADDATSVREWLREGRYKD